MRPHTAMIVAPPVMATSPVHPTTDQGVAAGAGGGEAEQPPRGLYQGHERGHADEDPAQEYRAPRGRVLVLFRDAFEELQQGQPAEESGQRPEEDADDGEKVRAFAAVSEEQRADQADQGAHR